MRMAVRNAVAPGPSLRPVSFGEATRAVSSGSGAALFCDCWGGGWAPGSFLLGEPAECFVFDSTRAELPSGASPFRALERAVASAPELIWAGYISYDAGRLVERIPSKSVRDRDLPEVYFCGYRRVERVELPATAGTPEPPVVPDQVGEGWEESLGRQEYQAAVARALDHIRAGDFYQVNIARRVSAPASSLGVSHTGQAELVARSFEYLCRVVSPPRGALLQCDDAFVLSASPELFLSVTGDEVTTRPIKGTRPRGRGAGRDAQALALAASAKDRAENVMIVDLLRNDLGKVAVYGSVEAPSLCAVESFATVHHLVSTVKCKLRPDTALADLLEAVFPGGSVTGAPKVAAMQFIEEVERVRRSVYTGAIGYLDPTGRLGRELGRSKGSAEPWAEFSIAIRTLTLTSGVWDLWVGGGIVADSDPAAEWEETVDKSRGLAGVLLGAAEQTPVGKARESPATGPQKRWTC